MSLLHSGSTTASDSKLYPEDVFSTYLYTGNGSTQTINNGIDLAGKGGLVWSKGRNLAGYNHCLMDTARSGILFSDTTQSANDYPTDIQSYNANGFTLKSSSSYSNIVGTNYASWTFRKAPKFFDVVTYTGNDVAGRQIPHNLGCEVGMMVVKQTNASGRDWAVYHVSQGNTKRGFLNLTEAFAVSAPYWNSTTPSSMVFTLGNAGDVNASGDTYVAYLFAHDPSVDGIIQCGSFTTDASGNATVNLGWEPQYILYKPYALAVNWFIVDTARGLPVGNTPAVLYPNNSGSESSGGVGMNPVNLTATGFTTTNSGFNSTAFIYLAIRRPNKVPTSGTEVFAIDTEGSTQPLPPSVKSGFPVDLDIYKSKLGFDSISYSRLTGKALRMNLTNSEEDINSGQFAFNNGFGTGQTTDANKYHYMFKRAKGFFDVVCYTGTEVARTVNHNLGVAPELMIVKRRDTAGFGWEVYSATLGATKVLELNSTTAAVTYGGYWNNTSPTSSVFSLGASETYVNASGGTYVAYLFASCPGVSKVGSYTGNGSSQTINCGFSAGARFILIKRTDSAGDWKIIDSVRGITASSDPTLALNSTAAEVTGTDCIDPNSAGFDVVQEATNNLNVNGGQYVFLAIS